MTSARPELWTGIYAEAHYRDATDPANHTWQRVGFAALWRVRGNGHARFEKGELATIVGTNRVTGEIKPDPKNLSTYIRQAVTHGWLAKGSSARCLIVPASRLRCADGREHETCGWCERPETRSQRGKLLTRANTDDHLVSDRSTPCPQQGDDAERLVPDKAMEEGKDVSSPCPGQGDEQEDGSTEQSQQTPASVASRSEAAGEAVPPVNKRVRFKLIVDDDPRQVEEERLARDARTRPKAKPSAKTLRARGKPYRPISEAEADAIYQRWLNGDGRRAV